MAETSPGDRQLSGLALFGFGLLGYFVVENFLAPTVPFPELVLCYLLLLAALWWVSRSRSLASMVALTSALGLLYSPLVVEHVINAVEPLDLGGFVTPDFAVEDEWSKPSIDLVASVHSVVRKREPVSVLFYLCENHQAERIAQWDAPFGKRFGCFRKNFLLGLAYQPSGSGWYVDGCVVLNHRYSVTPPRKFVKYPLRFRSVQASVGLRKDECIVFAVGDQSPHLTSGMSLAKFCQGNAGTHIVAVLRPSAVSHDSNETPLGPRRPSGN